MYKIIDCSSFFPQDEVTVTLLNLKDVSVRGLEKTAADDRISDYVSQVLKPVDGKFYLHINAMGAGEYYGSNRNGDYFPEEQLRQYHKTFEETGYVYRHHVNKDPAKSMGRVIFSIYNERMHRVELVAEVDMVLGRDIYDRIQRGDFPQTSMACRTPYDVCSVCGNKAHSRQEYCVHINTQLNRVMGDGKKVMALNLASLRFFDISIVIKPADVTSSVLQKVAEESQAVLSIDEADSLGFVDRDDLVKKADTIKKAAFKKLADIVKKIDGGEVMSASHSLKDVLSRLHEPGEDLLDILSAVPLEDSLNALAEIGVNPSIAFMSALIARKVYHKKVDLSFGHVVADFISGHKISEIPKESMDLLGHIEVKDANPHLVKAILNRSDSSLLPSAVEKRAYQTRYYENEIDTTSHLPMYDSRPKQERDIMKAQLMEEARKRNLGEETSKTLFGIGGAAIMAKAILASMLEEKFSQSNMLKVRALENELKYRGVIKSASVTIASAMELTDAYLCYILDSVQRGRT